MTDKSPDLATAEEAKEALGDAAYSAAVLSGELRRVQHAGTLYALGVDVDRLRRAHGRNWLARLFGLFNNPKQRTE